MIAGAIWTVAAGTALARAAVQEMPADSGGARVVRSFTQCRAITDAAARLDCFDKAAEALDRAVASKDVQIMDRGDVRRARRSLFGFNLPQIGLFGGGEDSGTPEEAFVEINTTIAATRLLNDKRVEFRLADESGATWQTTAPVDFPPRVGAKVRIRQAALGSYFIAINGGRSVRGMRVR